MIFSRKLPKAKKAITVRKEMVYTPARVVALALVMNSTERQSRKNRMMMRGELPRLFSFSRACGRMRSSVMRFTRPETPT